MLSDINKINPGIHIIIKNPGFCNGEPAYCMKDLDFKGKLAKNLPERFFINQNRTNCYYIKLVELR